MFLKLFFFVSILLFSYLSFSQTSPICEKEAHLQIKELNAAGPWFEIPATDDWLQIIRSPTSQIGTWVEWRSRANQIEIVQISNSFQKQWTWKKQQCHQPIISTPQFKTVDPKASFTDAEFEKILNSQKKTIIYIWNSGAAYSVKYKQIFKNEAAQRKMNWVEIESKNLGSLELIFRGGLMHFPTSFLLGNKKISRKIVGALEKNNVASYFDEYQKDIQ